MTMAEVYQVARQAGFPPATAVRMVAIAWRESGGNAQAFNGSGLDQSYGLWQINMRGAPERLAQFGLSSPEELWDPYTNARAAYLLWGGSDANLARHWYIDRTGPPYYYAEKYQANLGPAQQAAQVVEGGGGWDLTWPDWLGLDLPRLPEPGEDLSGYSSLLVVTLVLGALTYVAWRS